MLGSVLGIPLAKLLFTREFIALERRPTISCSGLGAALCLLLETGLTCIAAISLELGKFAGFEHKSRLFIDALLDCKYAKANQ